MDHEEVKYHEATSNDEERTNHDIKECLAVRKGEKIAVAHDDGFDEEDGVISESTARGIDHPSYHGTVNKEEAELKLCQILQDCYLTRFSAKRKVYVLSVLGDKKNVWHFDIERRSKDGIQEFRLKSCRHFMSSIPALLEFYETNRLSKKISSIGSCLRPEFSPKTPLQTPLQTPRIEADVADEPNGFPFDMGTPLNIDSNGYERTFSGLSDCGVEDCGVSEEEDDTPKTPMAAKVQEPSRIDTHPSYHGHLNREKAESRLSQLCPHSCKKCYLTRYSENTEMYKISVATRDESGKFVFQHLNIIEKRLNGTYRIEGALAEYNNIATLLKCHQDIPVGDKVAGLGECCVFRRSHSEEAGEGSRANSSSSSQQQQKHKRLTSSRSEGYKSQVSHEEEFLNSGPTCSKNSMTLQDLSEGRPFPHLAEETSDPIENMSSQAESKMKVASKSKPHPQAPPPELTFQHASTEVVRKAPSPGVIEGVAKRTTRMESVQSLSYPPSPSLDEHMSTPKLDLLTLMRYKQKRLEIIKTVCKDWRYIGQLLGQSMGELDGYWERSPDYSTCCSRVFDCWINNNGHPSYPLSWEGLYKLLRDIKHRRVANELKKALTSMKRINFKSSPLL